MRTADRENRMKQAVRRLSGRIPRIALTHSVIILGLTLLLGALFKLSAMGREAFIASQFGLSSATDSYFALQQLPITVAGFMLGPFTRAFTPAYGDSYNKEGGVDWFGGLMFYCVLIGLLLTGLSFCFASQILEVFTRSNSWATLAALSICYVPIVFIALRAATLTSHGKNLLSLTVNGLPYLLMTLVLIGMYFAGAMGSLSLAISMSAGFAGVGIVSLGDVLWTEKPFRRAKDFFRPWRSQAFRRFARQLTASSIETAGFFANQFTMLFLMARAGTGAISANNCATRIGMLGYSLFAQPMMQLLQARLCRSPADQERRVTRRYTVCLGLIASLSAAALYLFRYPVVSLVYMRGNFSATALEQVVSMLPAWLCYCVVTCLNCLVSQHMFHTSNGYRYTRNMLAGYIGTNLLRFTICRGMSPAWIIWSGVIAEGGSLIVNVFSSADLLAWTSGSVAVEEADEVVAS
jgi:peptidoglycan biosynthesis protein MviN/MurJ (putative lipid II flippase)